MIDFLQGTIIDLTPTHVVLLVGDIGYRLEITIYTHDIIKEQTKVKLYTHVYVKNEGQNLSGFVLYGFSNAEERLYFSTIIGVSGIGASTARLMLSALQPSEIAKAIALEEVSTFTSVKGVGPKTAKRLILELKDKIPNIQTGTISEIKSTDKYNTIAEEALTALTLLGFSKSAAQKAILSVLKTQNVETVEELIKLCLKKL